MAYQSLYRKYRPQRFAELVGQEHVTSALRNAVREDRIGHAYLFSGPRGTGKTTTARILAKALNCSNRADDGEPCGVCDNCVAIADGRFLDIRELDAASNRGIDNVRDVIDSTALGLAPGSHSKLYVLDEVHMLTEPASNALLKTLEEAPPHVVFVLATTNPEKVLPTIRSRTQHYEFTLMAPEVLTALLAEVCEQEGVDAEPDALAAIAAAGAGSARDSLSLLDQAIAHGTGSVKVEAVQDLFGRSPFALRLTILEAIAAENAPGALLTLDQLLQSGHEPRRVAEDLLSSARDSFLFTAGAGGMRADLPDAEQVRLREVGQAMGNAALVRTIETIGQAVTDMRGTDASDPRLVLEVALVRLSRRDAGPPLQTVVERIERLERSLATGSPATPAPSTSAPPAAPSGGATEAPAPPRATLAELRSERTEPVPPPPAAEAAPVDAPVVEEPAPSAPLGPVDVDDVIVAWSAILPGLPVATRSAVQAAQPLRVDDDVLVFGVPPTMLEAAKPRFKKEADTIRAALAERLGRSLKFTLEPAEQFSLGGPPRAAEHAPPPDASEPDGSEPEPESEHDIDLTDTVDVAPSADPAGVGLLRDQLGATVVEELPRDA